jgi:hypothetical protein
LHPCQLSFQVGDPAVEEPVVVAGPGEPFLEPTLVLGKLAQPRLKGVVFGEDSLDTIWRQVVLKVTDVPEQFSDPVSLGGDLLMRTLELMLCVECPLPPARLRGVRAGVLAVGGATGLAGSWCDEGPGLGVLVEEGAGDGGSAGHRRDGHLGVLSPHLAQNLGDPLEHLVGGCAAGLYRSSGAVWLGRCGAHVGS